jgi:hypothetical protein
MDGNQHRRAAHCAVKSVKGGDCDEGGTRHDKGYYEDYRQPAGAVRCSSAFHGNTNSTIPEAGSMQSEKGGAEVSLGPVGEEGNHLIVTVVHVKGGEDIGA